MKTLFRAFKAHINSAFKVLLNRVIKDVYVNLYPTHLHYIEIHTSVLELKERKSVVPKKLAQKTGFNFFS